MSAEALPEPRAAWAPFAASGRFLGRERGGCCRAGAPSVGRCVGQSSPERAPARPPHAGRSQQPRKRLPLEVSAGSPSAVDCGPSAALGAGAGVGTRPARPAEARTGRPRSLRSLCQAQRRGEATTASLPVLATSQQCPRKVPAMPGPGKVPPARTRARGWWRRAGLWSRCGACSNFDRPVTPSATENIFSSVRSGEREVFLELLPLAGSLKAPARRAHVHGAWGKALPGAASAAEAGAGSAQSARRGGGAARPGRSAETHRLLQVGASGGSEMTPHEWLVAGDTRKRAVAAAVGSRLRRAPRPPGRSSFLHGPPTLWPLCPAGLG